MMKVEYQMNMTDRLLAEKYDAASKGMVLKNIGIDRHEAVALYKEIIHIPGLKPNMEFDEWLAELQSHNVQVYGIDIYYIGGYNIG